ncbi:RsmB/NOP family class I SAM-dependent RNA methyltransferase [Hydrogenophaga sp.]|uniref:RsmB/NOP family class I SAM-dependent RNA methyltransferase n=1 Tax=Hydrogenophaga sp. TaxID=1904254 RepID=UPI00271DDC0B|nr:RsmB/NOP family class I SAM-dependent RNA methyltransferase [Hydrogenophaga sp.]MDO9133802.1 RsmB/NOP family class I SAM-dependent RNA methyltransferase [Hydrogenophaga sp.]MDO9604102.1 RsmB/NOP family class I SAM-dependent RNA methyltransferase [Hydrogenophaga sp.]MDP2166114.1 RsmB/NOP family class I SAM-dependent RNA methyltransferase [Hydrogenophaga sp.]MDP3476677.1 RsmB/NOP family class I SAM-dependent RNA methyltransferase [Hydrogenophaga sp.]
MHPKALLDESANLIELVYKFEHPADAVVSRYFREHRSLGPRERATLSDTVYATLRERLKFEWLARSGSGSKWRRLAVLGFPGDRDFLKSALTDVEKNWLDRCDAVTDADLMAPHRHNLPEWLATALREQVGPEFDALVASLNQPAPLDLRVNVLKKKREAVLAELRQAGLSCEPTPYSPMGIRLQGKPSLAKLPAFVQGDVEVQDEGSQLLALLLDAKRGEMVVDFCAGAGGKTLAIGAAMRNSGRLYAFDTSGHRLDALKPRLARSGLSNVHPVAIAHERDDRIKRLAGKIDRVLVDAPCSGLGTLRRSPDLKWRQNPQTVAAQAELQQAILRSAARLLKPGGRLVYATCSLLPAENELVAQAFSEAHPDFDLVPVAGLLAVAQVPDAASLCILEGGQMLRLWPHRHATDGFFAAVWQKKT